MAYDFRETPLNTDLGNVFPSTSINDPSDSERGNSVVSGDVGMGPWVLSDLEDIFSLKLRLWVSLSSRLSSTFHPIAGVILSSPPAQVSRIYARRIVAGVESEVIGWLGARRTRFNQCPSLAANLLPLKLSLPVTLPGETKRPNPTLIGVAVFKLFLKPFVFVSVESGSTSERATVPSQAMVVGKAKSHRSRPSFASFNRANGKSSVTPMVVVKQAPLFSVKRFAATIFDTGRIFWNHRSSSLGSVAGQDVSASLPSYFTTEVPCGV